MTNSNLPKMIFRNWKRAMSLVAITLLTMVIANAQIVNVPITAASFNNDIIASPDGSFATNTATTGSVPGVTYPTIGTDGNGPSAYTLVANNYRWWSGGTLATCGLPASNTFTSVAGVPYVLQSYTANNVLTVTSGTYGGNPFSTTGSINLTTPASYGKLFVLYESVLNTPASNVVNATVTFTDLTTQTFSNTVVNWFTVSGVAYNSNMQRCQNAAPGTPSTCALTGPCLFEMTLNIAGSNFSKLVQSVSFAYATAAGTSVNTVNYFHTMSLGGLAPCATPIDQPSAFVPGTINTGSISGTFTAAPSVPSGYLIVRYPTGASPVSPSDGTTYTTNQPLGTGTVVQSSNALAFTASGLFGSTTYDFYIYSYNNAVTCAGPVYLTTSPYTFTQTTSACGVMSGIIPVGPTAPASPAGFATLTDAINYITANGLGGATILELQSNYLSSAEPSFPITLSDNPCINPVNNLTIRPAAGATGLSIISNSTTGTINFNGGDYVTIDGRPGGSGSPDLIIENTNVGFSYAILFTNDATNNAIKYCTVRSTCNFTTLGSIAFTTGAATGNDNNTIDNCTISDGASMPANAIYSLGTSAAIDNSGNTISNCNISNYFSATAISSGILLTATGNSGWTITGNRLFQTSNRIYTTGVTHNGIAVLSGSGYTINNNVVGFANASGTGTTNMIGNSVALTGTFPTSYTTTGTANVTRYIAINCAFTAGGTVSNIQNNTIGGFALYSSSGASTTNGIWCGINVTSGNANIGTTTGNTIGSTSGLASVYTACTTTGGSAVGIYATSTNSVNIQNNNIGGFDASGTTATLSGGITGIDVAGTGGVHSVTNNFVGNTTVNNMRTGYFLNAGNLGSGGTATSTTGATAAIFGIRSSATGATVNLNSNTIRNFQASGTVTAFTGVINSGAATSAININSNSVSGVSFAAATHSGIVRSIYISATGAAAATSVNSNTFQNYTYAGTATGEFTFIYVIGTASSHTISGNTLTGSVTVPTTGSTYLIYNSQSTSNLTITNNNLTGTGFNRTGASGTMFAYYNFGVPGVGTANVTGNIVNGVTLAGTSAFDGIEYRPSTSQIQNISNNTITNIVSGSGVSYGIYHGYGAVGSVISNNTINNISGSGTVYGIFVGQVAPLGLNCSSNTVHTISTTGAAAIVYGIYHSLGAATSIFKNKVYNIQASGATGAAHGIYVNGGTTINTYNNLIGDVRATTSSLTAPAPSVSGIYFNGGTTNNVYYNSVYLNATGAGANFGSAALYANTTTALTLRNNLLSNNSTPNGTGKAVAYQRSSTTLTSYNAASNNNLFYAGAPGVNNLIHFDGTNPFQTLAAYKAMTVPGTLAPRDAASISEDLTSQFVSVTGSNANFLNLTGAATQAESGGTPVTSPNITDDYAGNARSGSFPDIGAWEFTGTSPAPSITFNSITPSTNQCVAASRAISLDATTPAGTITGVAITYSFNGTPQGTFAMTNSSGNTWIYTIPAATPTNGLVTWSATATNSSAYSVTYTGASYQDDPTNGIVVNVSATQTSICLGQTTDLSVALSSSSPSLPSTPPPGAVTSPTIDEDLGNVTITQGVTTILNNTTPYNSLVGTIGTATGTAGGYSNFTAFGPYVMKAGVTYNFSLSSLQGLSAYSNGFGIYIDYNRNGSFLDANEFVYVSPALIAGAHTRTGSFTVPANVSLGRAVMRVISKESSLVSSPTTGFSWGEFEDYAIDLQGLGTAYSWSDGFTTVGSTNPITVTPPSGITTYTVDVTHSSGCTITGSMNVTTNALPSAPTSTNSTQCGYGVPIASVTSTSGAPTPSFNWYAASSGGIALQTGTTTTYTSGVNATTTFYVSEVAGVCESSPRTAVTVNVTPADAINIVTNAQTCVGTANPFSVNQTGSNQTYTSYLWYATPQAGSGLSGTPSGVTQTFTPSTVGTYNYWVIASDGVCSAIDTQSVQAYVGLTGSVTATQILSCVYPTGLITTNVSGAGTVVNNDFTSSTLPSYMTIQGSASITGGELVVTPTTSGQSGSVLVQNTTGLANNDFQIDFDFITKGPAGIPFGPTAADGLSYSYGDDVVAGTYQNVANASTNIGYPSGSPTGNVAEGGSGTKLKISFDPWNNGVGTLSGINGGTNYAGIYFMYNCTDYFNAVQSPTGATANDNARGVLAFSPATWWRATSTQTALPVNTTHVTIVMAGAEVGYPNGSTTLTLTGTTGLAQGNVFGPVKVALPPGYLAADKSTWKHVFAARTGGNWEGHSIDNLSIRYNNFYEYSIDNGATWSQTTPIVPPTSGTYPVLARYVSVPGCFAPIGTATINAPSFTTNSTQQSICAYSTSMPTLSFSPVFGAGATYQWQSSPAGMNTWTNVVGATNTTYALTAGSITADTDFRCEISCGGVQIPGSPTSTNTIAVVNPSVVTTSSPNVRCGPGTLQLTGTATAGADLNWYTAPTGGTGTLGSPYTTPVVTTSTSFYVSAIQSGCESPRTTVAVTVTPSTPVTANTSHATICIGQSATLTATSTNPAYNYTWNPGGLAGASVVVSPASNTTYTLEAFDPNDQCTAIASVTVNAVNQLAPDPTASSNAPVCEGASLGLSGDNIQTGQSSGNIYSWTGPNSYSSTQQNPNVTSTATALEAGIYTVVVTNQYLCTASITTTVTVNPNPTLAVLSVTGVSCVGQCDGYVAFNPTGGTGAGTYLLIDDLFNFSSNDTIFNYCETGSVGNPLPNNAYVTDGNGCNSNSVVYSIGHISAAPPSASVLVPPINNLPVSACNGTVVNNINVPAVATATQYIWDGPTGTMFSGSNPYISTTSSANITFGNPNGSGYYIGVQAANGCGTSIRKVQWVRGTVSVPAAITGATTACPSTSGTYTTGAVTGATQYLWTVTGDATVSGTGTTANVNFGPTFTTGTLCVAAQTSCYTSATKCITITNAAAITTQLLGTFIACPGQTLTYSVAPVSGAASYAWTLPPGTTGSSTTNSINVTFGIGFTGGNITVQVTSICGVLSPVKSRTINSGVPPSPASITGPLTGLCGQTIVYTCPSQSGVTFTWTVPAGATINSGQGTNAISVTFGTFGTSTVCVTAGTLCGTSIARCITVKGAPNAPGAITAIPASWCANTAGVEFDVDVTSLTGSYTLSWLYPGPTIATYVLGGGNSTSLILNWLTGSGPVNVTASNACGNATRTSTQANSCREGEEMYNLVQTSESNIIVYPNPTSGNINIEFSSITKGNANITIQDISGRTITSKDINVTEGLNQTQLDLSKVAKGIYMLNVNSNETTGKVKVVVE